MGSAAIRNEYSTLPVSKWDARIRNNKRKRNAEIRKHILLLIFAVVFIFVAILGINRMISEAGKAEEEALSFKYYKSIRIESGDTLTSVAHTYADQVHYENHHKYIQEVVYMNHLEDADDIREGTYLIIPYYSNELLK
ncbi:MAG: hypothetical protein HFI11_13930 [Lachnospiraceae bacterium]|jgi:cell division protein YceG involved in septum cleavage|nr:hypothetical protein [Lachnospiraceae bacterium]